MKKIIIPVDFSDCSINAVHYGVSLAKILNAKLELLYVQSVEITEPYTSIVDLKIQNLVGEIKKSFENVSHFTRKGNLHEEIINFAENQEADLIVMGTNGVQHTYDLLYGTNTSNLIKKKKIPVLVVPTAYKKGIESSKRPIVFATDFTGLDYIPSFYFELLNKLNLDLEVFHAEKNIGSLYEDELLSDQMQLMESLFQGVKVNFNCGYENKLVEMIDEFAQNNQAQMITMISHDRSFLANLLHTSATESMSLYTNIPFLAIPDKKAEINMASTW